MEALGGLPEFIKPLIISASGGGPLLTRGLSGVCADAFGIVNIESEVRRDVSVLEKKRIKANKSERMIVLTLLLLNLPLIYSLTYSL